MECTVQRKVFVHVSRKGVAEPEAPAPFYFDAGVGPLDAPRSFGLWHKELSSRGVDARVCVAWRAAD